MRKGPALVLLAAVSVAAGAWLFRPAPERPVAVGSASRPPQEDDAAAGSTPAARPGAEAAPEPAPVPAAKQPSTTAKDAAPAATPSAADLRSEADRLLATGHYREGIDALRAATKADPSVRNLDDLGSVLAGLLAFDEALVYLRQAAALDPGNADRWLQMATLYYRVTDPGAAWDAERRAKEAEPGLELGWDAHGNRVRKGDTAPRKP